MKPTACGRLTLAVGLVVCITACSVADYQKPISDFAKATQNAETALVGLDEQVTEAYAALHRRRALAGERLVQRQGEDCLVESARCRLVVVDTDRSTEPLSPDPALRNMITLMRSVRVYADGLSAIVNADTAANVATHVNATIGSVENLAKTVVKLGGQDTTSSIDLSEYTTPVGQAVNWLVGQYVAKVQLDGLKRATKDAKDVVKAAASVFGSAAEVASVVPRAALAEAVSKRIDAFRDSQSDQNLNNLIESAAKYDQLLLAKPATVFARLDAAHEALVDKLQTDELSLANVMAKIEAFAAEAETLAKILKDLAAAGKEKEEA